jgi:hypothetical protein
MRTCFIYQPQGVGDIVFIQKIVHHYRKLGYKIVFPLFEFYSWIIPYLQGPNISFPLINNDRTLKDSFEFSEQFYYLMGSTNALFRKPVISDEFIYLSCGPSTTERNDMMVGKYSAADVDHQDWQKYVKLNRNTDKENNLFYNILDLKDDTEYTLINQNCSSHYIDIPPPLGKTIYMTELEGYSVFDWIKVIEKCSRLITVDTSVPILAEVYLPKNIPCHLISRYMPPSFVDLPKIFRLDWQYCLYPNEIKT